ncbi:putative complex 1 LYR protein [Dioscorea sansibarensis]
MVGSLGLHAFITRSRVLKLYRQALRIARRAPSQSRDELKHMMRQEMEKNRHCNDKQKVRFLISDGLQRIKDLDEMLDMQGRS